MFKRRKEETGNSTVGRFAFKIFYMHILNIIVFVVLHYVFYATDAIFGTEISSGNTETIIITVLCLLLYVINVYLDSWRTGERDLNLVTYKRIRYKSLKPLYAALISQIPGFITAALILTGFADTTIVILRLITFFYVDFLYPISLANIGEASKIMYFIPILFAPIIAIPAYHLGFREVRLLDKLMFAGSKKQGSEKTR